MSSSFQITIFLLVIVSTSLYYCGKTEIPAGVTIQKNVVKKCTDEEYSEFPHHCHLFDLIDSNPKKFSDDLRAFSKDVGFVVQPRDAIEFPVLQSNESTSTVQRILNNGNILSKTVLPSVLAHGMGDSCFNEGMQSITKRLSQLTNNQYATCIPTGDTQHDDTINGYFLNMDASIDIFFKKVKADPNLTNGFNAVGFSQGNNIIRGYIAKYNDPPVNTFVSVNGVNAGVGAVPYCMPKPEQATYSYQLHNAQICNALMEIASHKAYSDFAQKHSFQANYWRDPRNEEINSYRKYSQLAKLNNEGEVIDSTLNENYAKTNRFVWVMATKDRVVWPPEGEQWGAPNPTNPYDDVLSMNQTEWYLKDLFGLKTAQEEGKNYFESFDGNHLQFSMTDFDEWITKYF